MNIVIAPSVHVCVCVCYQKLRNIMKERKEKRVKGKMRYPSHICRSSTFSRGSQLPSNPKRSGREEQLQMLWSSNPIGSLGR